MLGPLRLRQDPRREELRVFEPGPINERPGTEDLVGEGVARGTKLNIDLPPHQDDAAYLERFGELEAFIDSGRPEFVVFEAGLDAMDADPMAHQCLTVDGIRAVTRRVQALADRHAEGRLLVLGGGGYDMDNCAVGWAAVVEELLGS